VSPTNPRDVSALTDLIRPNDSYSASVVGNCSHHSYHLPPHPDRQFSPLASPHNRKFDHCVHHSPHQYSSTTRTPDSEMAQDGTSSASGPPFSYTPLRRVPSQWYQAAPSPMGSAGVNTVMRSVSPGYNSYFPKPSVMIDCSRTSLPAQLL
jgi:hypothetical protein